MSKTTIAALALALSIGGALAQTNAPPTSPAAPGAGTGSPGSNTPTGSSNPSVNPSGNAPSGVNASGQATVVPLTALERGANSFTEGQARTRLEGAGLTTITELAKDEQGIWRGKAMRGGQNVVVGFDYKGNIGVQ